MLTLKRFFGFTYIVTDNAPWEENWIMKMVEDGALEDIRVVAVWEAETPTPFKFCIMECLDFTSALNVEKLLGMYIEGKGKHVKLSPFVGR